MDVLDHPDLAGKEGIFATPTLVKYAPEPVMRFIGDVGNSENMPKGLSLKDQLQRAKMKSEKQKGNRGCKQTV